MKKILEKYELIRAIGYLNQLSGWDMRTYMPDNAVQLRGQAHGQIGVHLQKLMLEKDLVSMVESLVNEQLNDTEKGIYRMLKKEIDENKKLPETFVHAWEEATNEGMNAWKHAREQNNFSLFEPYLSKIVDLTLEKAELLGYKDHPYDALLNEYEHGLTTKQVSDYFSEIKEPLQRILAKTKEIYLNNNGIEKLTYDRGNLQNFNQKILDYLGFDPKNIRLDLTTHPFCSGLTSHDVRITMRFEKDFNNTIFGSMHEYGHALYELGSAEELNKTPISGGSSLVIHESQSRFWENIVGRSQIFTEKFTDDYKNIGKGFDAFGTQQFYEYINHVEPGFIRVDADELTYHFHIMIRFEIEKAIMEKKVTVKELPAYWNKMYKEYLGIDVPSDSVGVLQDVHWSSGGIGYFPTYSMGTALSLIWRDAMEKDLGSIDTLMGNQQGISKMKEWLRSHIHQYGSTYTLNELLEKNGLEFNTTPLLTYLENKYC